MEETIHINTLAYMENGSSAQIIATFCDEGLYAACAPAIEAWIAKQDPDCILTESCEWNVTIDVSMEEEHTDE